MGELTPRLQLDIEDHREEIDQLDFSEQEKIEYLETLWNILQTFARLNIGVDSVQMCLPDKFENAGEECGGLVKARKRREVEIEQGGHADDQ